MFILNHKDTILIKKRLVLLFPIISFHFLSLGHISHTLQGMASTMVGAAAPNLGRRQALLPSLTHVRTKKKSSVMNRHKDSTIKHKDSASCPSLMITPGESFDTKRAESIDFVSEAKSSPVLHKRRMSRRSSSIKSFLSRFGSGGGGGRGGGSSVGTNSPIHLSPKTLDPHLSLSDGGHLNRDRKHSVHLDIQEYTPRKLSRDEARRRKKISQVEFAPWMQQHLINSHAPSPPLQLTPAPSIHINPAPPTLEIASSYHSFNRRMSNPQLNPAPPPLEIASTGYGFGRRMSTRSSIDIVEKSIPLMVREESEKESDEKSEDYDEIQEEKGEGEKEGLLSSETENIKIIIT